MAVEAAAVRSGARPQIGAPIERPVRLVTWFASAGACFVALQLYVYARWVGSGTMERTPTGGDAVPAYMKIAVVANQIIMPIAGILTVYFLIVKPWRRDGRLPLAGYLAVAGWSVYWQDAAASYFNPIFGINAYAVNWGSWYNFIPGWASPRGGHIAEPVLAFGPVFASLIVLPALGAARLMRRAKAKWPQLGKVGVFAVAVVGLMLFDFVAEFFWARTGVYVFAGTLPGLTLFHEHYYQIPLYEMPLTALFFWGPSVILLYFRDDKGASFVDRGVEDLRVGHRWRSGVKLLSYVGFLNLGMMGFNIAMAFISLLPGFAWSPDLAHRSYLRNGLCGAGTTYACPARDVPVPKRGGSHVSPDGTLVPASRN